MMNRVEMNEEMMEQVNGGVDFALFKGNERKIMNALYTGTTPEIMFAIQKSIMDDENREEVIDKAVDCAADLVLKFI